MKAQLVLSTILKVWCHTAHSAVAWLAATFLVELATVKRLLPKREVRPAMSPMARAPRGEPLDLRCLGLMQFFFELPTGLAKVLIAAKGGDRKIHAASAEKEVWGNGDR